MKNVAKTEARSKATRSMKTTKRRQLRRSEEPEVNLLHYLTKCMVFV